MGVRLSFVPGGVEICTGSFKSFQRNTSVLFFNMEVFKGKEKVMISFQRVVNNTIIELIDKIFQDQLCLPH